MDIDNIFTYRFILGSDPDQSLSCVAKKETTVDAKTNRIVGGNFANFAPYQIIFAVQMTESGKFLGSCGGTILNKRYILTAQHCLVTNGRAVTPKTETIKVIVGELNWCNAIGQTELPTMFKGKFESVKDVSEVYIYGPPRSDGFQEVDIAILKVGPDHFYFISNHL